MMYLLFALLFSTLIMVNFKLYPRLGIDALQAIVVNYLTAFVCGILSAGSPDPEALTVSSWFYTALLSGFFLITVFFVFSRSAARAGIAITSVSSKMSVIIPVLLGLLLFGENAGVMRLLGIVLAFPAFILIFSQRGREQKVSKAFYILPVLLFLGNGTNDSLLKYAEFHYLRSDSDMVHYLVVAFGTSLLLGSLFILFRLLNGKYRLSWRNLPAGIILGLLNWYSTYFFLAGLSVVDVSIFIPVFNLGIVVLGSLTGILVFREKIRWINAIGYLTACLAIYLIVSQQ